VDRAEKKEAVAALNEAFKATNVVVVAHYSGLTVAQMQTLRKQMKLAGASVKVAKNRLAKIALEGTDVASIAPLLKGPTVIAFSGDPVAAPKVAVDFAKANEQFVILGGSMGKTALTASRRLPRCRRWMNCGPRSSGLFRPRRPRSPRLSTLRPPRSRALFRPMPQRAKRREALRNLEWFEPKRTVYQWPNCPRS
jgi:hypothetical protein